jgi:hypothetical protein
MFDDKEYEIRYLVSRETGNTVIASRASGGVAILLLALFTIHILPSQFSLNP